MKILEKLVGDIADIDHKCADCVSVYANETAHL